MPPGNVGKFNTGWSFWQFQLHYAMRDKPGVTKPTVGMGEGFTKLTGWAPGDPRAWKDAARYALNRAKAGGWTPWYGAAHVGIGQWQGIDRNHPWDASAERWDYEDMDTAPQFKFDPDAPIDPQPDDWSCSVQSAQWLLRSIGRNPSRAWLEQQLVGPLSAAPIVSREYGLMDASGRTLAAWLQREYGDEMGVAFEARTVPTWEDLVAIASKGGAMLGGRTWNHWTGVRAYRDGKIALANPAGSWKGAGQELTRDEFDALGSWTAIVPRLPAAGVGNGPSTSNDEDEIHGLRTAVAYLADKVVPLAVAAAEQREYALAEAKRVREQYLGAKP